MAFVLTIIPLIIGILQMNNFVSNIYLKEEIIADFFHNGDISLQFSEWHLKAIRKNQPEELMHFN